MRLFQNRDYRHLFGAQIIALLFDAVNTRWQEWVIGYGPELQRTLLERLGFDGLRRTERSAVRT